MKFAWLTDIHLNFLEEANVKAFLEQVRTHDSDYVFVTGDIAEGPSLAHYLSLMDSIIGKPIYFVLGNHDIWGSSFKRLEDNLPKFLGEKSYLNWLSSRGAQQLEPGVGILGHECWYDCRNGDVENSGFVMADWRYMEDYAGCKTKPDMVLRSQQLADRGVAYFRKHLPDAIKRFNKIVMLTHFPPFAETHVFNNQIGEPHAQPYFTSRIMGELFLAAAKAHPEKQFVVFAGHTHGRISKQILPNLAVHVGGAEYAQPKIQTVYGV